MPLTLIVGPPNSARAGEIVRGFRDSIEREPLLVVPTADDAERFERELSEEGPLLGGSVVTFGGLFGELARTLDLAWEQGISRAQRTWLARVVARELRPPTLAGSSGRPGFAPALADLFDELQSAGLDPATFAERAKEAGEYENDLGRLFAAWAELRDRLGLADRHELARAVTAELRAGAERGAGDAWARRPVLIYGFDDLTREQLELVGALERITDVTVAVNYEEGRVALRARATLLAELEDLVPAADRAERRLDPDPKTTPNATLWRIDRDFLQPEAEPAPPGEGLTFLRAAGERTEAEQVGMEIARLLAAGAEPDQIAVVLRAPGRSALLWTEVLGGLGIPVAAEASVPLRATATGRALICLAGLAAPDAGAEELVAFLRTPGRAQGGRVDRLERAVRRDGLRSAAQAEEAWRGERIEGRELFELDDLRRAGSGAELLREAARLGRAIAERPHDGEAPLPADRAALELRAAAEAERALLELAELDPEGLGPSDLAEILSAVSVRLHPGPASGRVRLVSPYRLRARRVQHLFACSLQEGEFPRRDPGSPLLSEEQRGNLQLPKRSQPEDEERYLFSVCLSRPERTLALSWRHSDDEGRAGTRSPFVDDVRDLLLPPPPPDPEQPDPLLEEIGRERGLGDVVLDPELATSARELRRSLAARGRESWEQALAALELPEAELAGSRAALGEGMAATEDARLQPRNLRSETVLEALTENDLFGASTLEGYAVCSYRWLVGHELRPQRLDPPDEPLVLGSLAHRALELLYREPPGDSPGPRPETLDAWRERARELIEQQAPEFDLPASDPMSLAQIRRVEGLLSAFLADEARSERALQPDPAMLEARFDVEDDPDRPPLQLDGLRLHGMIDRVDVVETPEGRYGLVTDYKLSREVTPAAKLEEEGKLQLQLYALALKRLWDLEPAGSVYLPLRGTTDRKPRGILRKDLAETALRGLAVVGNDLLDPEEFEQTVERGERSAVEIAARIHRGRVRRDPIDNQCPSYCRWQTICRRERGVAEPEDLEDEDDE